MMIKIKNLKDELRFYNMPFVNTYVSVLKRVS